MNVTGPLRYLLGEASNDVEGGADGAVGQHAAALPPVPNQGTAFAVATGTKLLSFLGPSGEPMVAQRGMLDSFLDVDTPSRAERFALKYGALGLCPHGLPMGGSGLEGLGMRLRSLGVSSRPSPAEHDDRLCGPGHGLRPLGPAAPLVKARLRGWLRGKSPPADPTARLRFFMAESLAGKSEQDLEERYVRVEPLQPYFLYARAAQALLRLGVQMRDGRLGSPDDWSSLQVLQPEAVIMAGRPDTGENRQAGRRYLGGAITAWLDYGGVRFRVDLLDIQRPQFALSGSTFGYIGLQLMNWITRTTASLCAGCQSFYVRPRKAPVGRANYCPDCRGKVANAQRQRAWRHAHREPAAAQLLKLRARTGKA